MPRVMCHCARKKQVGTRTTNHPAPTGYIRLLQRFSAAQPGSLRRTILANAILGRKLRSLTSHRARAGEQLRLN